MQLTLGYSPCPNDTFIFDALVHGRIDTEGLTFEPVLADVEALNQWAFAGQLAVTKLSYHALGHLLDRYALLPAGSALGRNCGPLLIARQALRSDELAHATVAIPGRYTTANFLLGIAYPAVQQRVEMLFSDIEAAVLAGRVDAGVIIHENRFTYAEKGLIKIADLGEYWEHTTGYPIPLGGIAVRRDLPLAVQQRIGRVIARSVAYAFEHPEASAAYVRAHAQEMEVAVMRAHIALYVNDFSLNLGEEGRAAVQHLYERATEAGLLAPIQMPIMVPDVS